MKKFIKKKTPIQAFFCEICKIFKNIFFCRTPPLALSVTTVFKAKATIYRSIFQNCTDSLHVTVRMTVLV